MIQKLEIPIQVNNFNDGKILSLTVEINKIIANFLLDTGASSSVIDLRKIDKFTSVKPLKSLSVSSLNKEIETYQVKINKFSIGESTIKNKIFNIIDLININNTLSTNNLKTIDGILGNDIIYELISNIDIKNSLIKLD